MRIKLPVLTEALEQAGTKQELAISASNEVCSLVEGYRREMSRMFEQVERRLSRKIDDVVGQALGRIDEHFIHIGNVQLEQHKQIQGILSGMMFLNQRQDRMEGDIKTLKQDVSGLKEDVVNIKQDVSGLKEDVSDIKQGQIRLDAKLDEVLKRI
ncbi:hypothetical protein [Endozoicomonas sp. 4G]|uniref:hypothetical protein n=1 Tax=Endozoicomonas sp. 4G TaxID=2872754 RepID=UPI002078CDB0|nr:hypothetical protein [Endozoicomonas sp. 4G]